MREGGRFILRFDDTDRERSRAEYADSIEVDLAWLGIVPDDRRRQSERLQRVVVADDGDLAPPDHGRGPRTNLVDPHLAAAGEDDGQDEGGDDPPHRDRAFDGACRGYPASATEVIRSSC